jgi:hypothetical protein
VCENHPRIAWSDECYQCVAGMPCECNRAEGHEEPDVSLVMVTRSQNTVCLGPFPVNELVGTGPFMHQPTAVCALKGACTGLMFLCSREQRPAMVAGEINGQFKRVHPDSMRVNLRDA